MLRRTTVVPLRVLCLTMLPDGGALTPALRRLGYTPYTLRSTYQQGHASTHPMEWAKLLEGEADTLPAKVLADYDAVVGPPGAMVYDALLRQAPSYTKVILVEEADKDGWAADYEAYVARLQGATRRASRNRITKAFESMIARMVVGGEAIASPTTGAAGSDSLRTSSSSPPASRRRMTTDAGDLRRAFAAEAASAAQKRKGDAGDSEGPAKRSAPSKSTTPSGTAAASAEQPAGDGRLHHPRAMALRLYEESVKMSIAPSSLLVYRYGDGWEPLCDFLAKPVPSAPFPDYDNGLRVLGSVQERIDRAHALQYFVGGICVLCVLAMVLPRCGGAVQFVKDLYTDYQVAFGSDSDAAPARAAAAPAQTEAEEFEAAWQKRGGSVKRTSDG